MKGKLIVIEGGDGSGKSTQFTLLKQRLEQDGTLFYTTKFPRHGEASSYFVDKMLQGGYGSLEKQNPYRTSLFYALDRFDAAPEIIDSLEKGIHVILDRYTSANIAHQGSKISDPEERKKYITWLEDLEYNICGIPKPDKVYYLHMPTYHALQLMEKRKREEGTTNSVDIHEADASYLMRTEEAYLEASKIFSNWEKIECAEESEIKTISTIHNELYEMILQEIR